MRLNKTMSEIYSTYDSRNCCRENFMNSDKARVCVSVLCVRLLLPTSTCQQNNYYFRSKHTHTWKDFDKI